MTLPTKEELDTLSMTNPFIVFRPVPERNYLLEPAGTEHYRLLTWISKHYGGVINEVGVYMGLGTACLASNLNNIVIGWDIDYAYLNWISKPSNIHLEIVKGEDFFSPLIFNGDTILVDAWHNGKLEQDIFDAALAVGWRGILIYDDIYYNDAMTAFWNNINHPGKIDATHIGHSTGTGIIDFSI
jgi:hypothetical protein